LIRKDNIKCAVLNPSGMACIPACYSEQTSTAQAASDPRKALDFNNDAGEDNEIDFFSLPVFEPIIDVLRQARNLKPLARLTQGNRAHGTSSSPTCL
jgi:hypothetical protein